MKTNKVFAACTLVVLVVLSFYSEIASAQVTVANPAKALFAKFEDAGYLQGGTLPVWVDAQSTIARKFVPGGPLPFDANNPATIELVAWAFFPDQNELDSAMLVLCNNAQIPGPVAMDSRRTMMVFGLQKPADLDPKEPVGTLVANMVEEAPDGTINDLAYVLFRPAKRKGTYQVIVSATSDDPTESTRVHAIAAASFSKLRKCLDIASVRLVNSAGGAASQLTGYFHERDMIKSGHTAFSNLFPKTVK